MNDYRLPFDEPIYRAINGLDLDWLNPIWVLASDRSIGIALAAGMGLMVVYQLRKKAIRPVLQVALTLLIVDQGGHELLKPFFGRLRPCFALHDVHQLVEIGNTGSMPSLHSANAFAFAVALMLCVPGSGRWTFPIAALIAVSRIGVGVHWPSDVLAGALFGAAVAAAVHAVFHQVARSQKGAAVTP